MNVEEIVCIGLLLLVFLIVVVLGRVFDSSPYTPEIKKQELLDKTNIINEDNVCPRCKQKYNGIPNSDYNDKNITIYTCDNCGAKWRGVK